jgi:hypothetical protein
MAGITLFLSYSHDPDSPSVFWNDARHAGNYLQYSAFDYATNKSNISWRRDGCGGAIKNNERTFNQELFNSGKGPLFSEFADGYNRKSADWAVRDALSLHPNYVCLYGYSGHQFYDQHRDLFDMGLRTMGYRFVPMAVTYPARVNKSCDFALRSVWVNRAVGRALVDYTLTVQLKGEAGGDAFSSNLGGLGCVRWVKGQQFLIEKTVKLGVVAPGKYQLCLAVLDPRTGNPIALPLKSKKPDGSYPIGTITVQ